MNTPGEIRIGRQALTLIDRVLEAAAPEEGCALLLGLRHGAGEEGVGGAPEWWRVRRVWPTLNVWEPAEERRRRFQIDPREQLLAQRWGRLHGLAVLGSVHSHPGSAATPSSTDLTLTYAPTLMVIRGLAEPGRTEEPTPDGDGATELGCWWLEPQEPPRLLPWTMED